MVGAKELPETSLKFVNVYGQRMELKPPEKKKQPKAEKEARHEGWVAMGISPDQVSEESRIKGASFDLDSFLNGAKSKRCTSRIYGTLAATQEAADLARRYGWHRVRVVERKVE